MSKQPKIVIVGGGLVGSKLAKELDSKFNVTLIEKREKFLINIATLRATVDPSVADKIFVPYDKLLKRGKILHAEVETISEHAVQLKNGDEVDFDYLVLAMGSRYPEPSKVPYNDSTESRKYFAELNEKLKSAKKVLIIGGGPVGVELAGEIATDFPDKKVTIVHSGQKIVTGPYSDKLRTKLQQKLKEHGITVVLGERVIIKDEEGKKTFTTSKGDVLEADLHFLCTGLEPNNEPLTKNFEAQLDNNGHVKVNKHLQVEGFSNIFAVGDLTNVAEEKTVLNGGNHVGIVVSNLTLLAKGKTELKEYKPKGPMILLTLGRSDGVAQFPGETVMGGTVTKMIKSKTLFVSKFWGELNQKYPK